VLPLGWLALLTGMFWIGDRSLYHKLFYTFLAFPTLLAILLAPGQLRELVRSPLIQAYLLFALYVSVSVAWSPDREELSLIKYPLYILMMLLAACLLVRHYPSLMLKTTFLSALLAVLSATLTLFWYVKEGAHGRLEGYGALYNPLLTTHIYGFYAAFWLAAWCSKVRLSALITLPALTAIVVLIICTGSRTPLFALAMSMLWLVLARPNWRTLLIVGSVFAGFIGLILIDPTLVTQRGASFRPAIWAEAWRQIQPDLWFGHGFNADMRIDLPEIGRPLADPHNLSLGVMYQTGLMGLILWALIYFTALIQAWRLRHNPLVLITGTLVVFGLAAGMTEGSAFLSRPKEHWFLVWIPLALLNITVFHHKTPRQNTALTPALVSRHHEAHEAT
jgi:O-antigen ligase